MPDARSTLRRRLVATSAVLALVCAGSLSIALAARDRGPTVVVTTVRGRGAPAIGRAPATHVRASTLHVVVIVMENKSLAQILGNQAAPYINRLAKTYALAANYHAIEHPSLPNYLDIVAGSDMGVHDDGEQYRLSGSLLASQMIAKGLGWYAYMQSMPADPTAPCLDPTNGLYHKKHNPFSYWQFVYDSNDSCGRVRPFSSFDPASLGRLNFIVPNICKDMHDCSIATGDQWLAKHVPPILSHMSGSDVLFLTWDEGTGSDNRVPMIVAGPGARRGYSDDLLRNHFGLLRTIEDLFGLSHLRHAADPGVRTLSALMR